MKCFFNILVLVFLTTASSCNNEKKNYVKHVVLLDRYERLEKDSITKLIEITMLNIYPAEFSCSSSEAYANLYIAKEPDGKVIYIFEPCMKVSDFVFDTTGRYIPLIVPEDILNEKQNKVIIFAPENFIIPKGAKYLFAKIGVLDES